MQPRMNKEGLTFEDWVCAAGVAVDHPAYPENVAPFSISETYWQTYYLGTRGTSDERFFDEVPRQRKRKHTRVFYSRKLRDAWRQGEDPSEWRVR